MQYTFYILFYVLCSFPHVILGQGDAAFTKQEKYNSYKYLDAQREISFANFPECFKSETIVLVSPSLKKQAINFITTWNLLIDSEKVISTQGFTNLPDQNIILITDLSDPIIDHFSNAILRYNKNFLIKAHDDRIKIFNQNHLPDQSIVQIFSNGKHVVLVYTFCSAFNDTQNYGSPGRFISQRLTLLKANLCLTDNNHRYFFFIKSKEGRIIYYTESGLEAFLNKYQNQLTAIFLFIMMLAFIIINRKIKKSQSVLYENS